MADEHEELEALKRELEVCKAEIEKLRKAEHPLRRLAEHGQEIIFRVRISDGLYDYLSPSFPTVYGYDLDECYATPHFAKTVMPQEWQGFFATLWDEICAGTVPPFSEFPIVLKSGEVRWLHERNWLIWDERHEHPVALEGIAIDVTENKRVEEALRKSEQQYRTTIDALGDLLHVVNEELRVVLMNEAGTRWMQELGLSEVDPIGRSVFELFPFLPARVRDEYQTVFRDAASMITEEHSTVGSKLFVTETRKFPVVERGKVVRVITVVRDVTDRYLAQEHLRQAEKMEALGQLAGGIAHDFNNQLSAILGYAELLRGKLADSQSREDAEMIGRAAARSADLTRQLLAFARKGKVLTEPIDVHATLREIVALLERTLDKRIRIRTDFVEEPCSTVGDPSQLHTALLNLAINARDAMPDGGELAFCTSRVSLSREQCLAGRQDIAPGRYVQIAVSDTGVGMSEETQRRLFEPFFTTKGPGKGTGMGLAAVYGTVLDHRGAIRVESAPGQGSTFTVLLPLSDAAEPCAAEESGLPGTDVARHVLVIDDEPAVLRMTCEALQNLGWTVTAFGDSRKAVEWYRRHGSPVDLVILDMAMPELNGADALAAIRAIHPSVRAIIVTGYPRDELRRTGAAILQKPFHIAELYRVVGAALRED